MARVIVLSCDNPECRILIYDPDCEKCPSCGCEDLSIHEDYES